MANEYGSDFMTIVDEDGEEYELEILSTLEYNGFTYLAVIPADGEEYDATEVSILKSVEEDGESVLCAITDDEELDAVNELIMDALYEDEDEDSFILFLLGACCVLVDPHQIFGTLVSPAYCRPPAYALTIGGRWEQRSMGTATHLPFRAGHNWMHTAKAGSMGSFGSPCFLYVNFFPFSGNSQIYPLKVPDKSVIIHRSML